MFSAGFREVASGAGYEADLVAAAARYGLPVCGPNGNGIVSPGRRVALWGDALGDLRARVGRARSRRAGTWRSTRWRAGGACGFTR